jgi:hypothetical protein
MPNLFEIWGYNLVREEMVSTGLVIGSYTDCNLYITSKQGIGTQEARIDCLTTCRCIALVLQHLTSSFNQILAFFSFGKRAGPTTHIASHSNTILPT